MSKLNFINQKNKQQFSFKKLNTKLLFAFVLGLILNPYISLSQHFNFKNISIEQGLQSSFVYTIQEDNEGYIWFATEKGISRYDGINFEYFGEKDGLTENGFYQITKDLNNVLWFVSNNFKVFYYKNKHFYQIITNEKICWIDTDKDNNKWFLTRNGCILKLNENLALDEFYKFPSQKDIIYYCLKKINQSSFIISSSYGIFTLNEDLNIKVLSIPINVDITHVIPRFFVKKNKDVLISCAEGIYCLTKNKIYQLYQLKDNQVYCFYEDTLNNDIWIGTLKGAVCFINGINKTTNKKYFLTDNIILNIFKNKEKSIWFSSAENGVYISNIDASHYNEKEGIIKKTIRYIKKDKDAIYIFSQDGTIRLLKAENKDTFQIKIPKEFIKNKSPINSTFQTINDGIFITKGNFFQLKNRKINPFNINNYKNWLHLTVKDNLNNLIYSTQKGCFKGVINPQYLFNMNDIYMHLINYNYGYSPLLFLSNDTSNLLYFKVDFGLMCCLVKNNNITYKKIPFPNKIQDVWMTPNKNLIIGTLDKGLCIYKNNKEKFYTLDNGLLSNYCTKTYFINNKIWICSNKGVSRIILDKNDSVVKISNFTSNDLLIYNEVNDLLIHKGDVYVATNKGVSVFPENIQLSTNKPKIFIENVQINNQDINLLDKYQLKYTENNIAIKYKSISFRSANHVFYKYQLTSKNGSSVLTTKLSQIQLSSLSPGNYTFSVWARNIDGEWSSEPAKIIFEIEPPFWLKWWFILIVILFFGAIVFFIINSRLGTLKLKNETKRRIIDAELKAIRLHMNPHFIFNTLSSLQYFILYNKGEQATKYLNTFSTLLRSVMNYSKQNEIELKNELELLEKYIELEQMRFENKFDYIVNVEQDIMYCLIPPLVLQPFIENSIKYGISNLVGKGKLTLSITKDGDFLKCKIQDNGIGREKAQLLKNDQSLKYESTGIAYTRERLRLLSKNENVENLVIVTDLYENNQACGTLVEIRIPIN